MLFIDYRYNKNSWLRRAIKRLTYSKHLFAVAKSFHCLRKPTVELNHPPCASFYITY